MTKKEAHPTDIEAGRRLRAMRQAAGLSQEALAGKVGITFQQVQKYEKGTNRLSTSRMVMIADALGIDACEFLRGLSSVNLAAQDTSFVQKVIGERDAALAAIENARRALTL